MLSIGLLLNIAENVCDEGVLNIRRQILAETSGSFFYYMSRN